jgi:class 3 adenylate cyclase/tetratricopeptide (TPR) repeat protein
MAGDSTAIQGGERCGGSAMTFEEMLDQALAMLQRRGRVTYGMLTRQFQLDEEALADLKEALLYTYPEVRDDAGRGLVWTGKAVATPAVPSPTASPQEREPRAYTPSHLAQKILHSRAALEGERKQVTVLFADLKGSMELLADRDPEEARQLLDPVLTLMMDAVHRYEGTVNQVMGDGIMALFGAPLAHEDHAVRACYAALAMQASVKQYAGAVQRTQGVPIQMRVGLNSGEVVVRSIGSDLHMDYTAVGQTTHLAARMEQMAMPGSILITPDVLRLVEGYVQVDPLGAVPIKGVQEPAEVYEVTGAGPVRTHLQAAAARGLTRFVGRQSELETLRYALDRAGRGQGQVVAVIGEPGVGKSRLFWEFTQSHRTHGWLRLESGSVSYGKATPYLPVIDLLKAYCEIEARDEARRMREKLTGKLLTLDETLLSALPAFLALLDLSVEDAAWHALDPAQRRQRTLEAVKRLLLRESQVQPLLVVVEDLHWIDSETQALLDGLVESLPAARLLLLVNYRPEYQHPWGGRTYYTQLRLDPLPPESAEELLGALLGADAGLEPLTRLLVARTEGNPFFLEESVQSLVETGALLGERGAYRLARPLPAIQVPATVQAVLAARIDRLPPGDKALLQTASVVGKDVPLVLLQAIAEPAEDALHAAIGRLQAAEFLYEAGLFPDLEYTFKHALTHEVAYGSLLQERRRVLHARIVEAIEALAGDRVTEQVERLAHHALRGEVWDKALAYCRQAGEKAMMRSAYREAVGSFEQALSALPHLPEQRDTIEQAVDLRLALRAALRPVGDMRRHLATLREAEALAEALDDPRRLGQVSVFLTNHLRLMSAHDQAITAAQRALALATAGGDVAVHAMVNQYLGLTYHDRGDYRRAIDCLGRTVVALDELGHRERFGAVFLPAVLSRAGLAWCHAELGTFAEGRALGAEGLRIAEAVAHPPSLMVASWGIGLLALRQGDLSRALPLLERAVGICQDADIPHYFPWMAAALGAAYTLAERVADAVSLLTQAMEQSAAEENVSFQALCRLPLSEAQLLAGRREEAHALAEHTLVLAREHQERGHQAYALHLLGDIAARREPLEHAPAEAHYCQALALVEELEMRPLQAHCHRGLGTLYAKIGRGENARGELSTAIDLYRSMQMTFWLSQAEAALAQVEGR